jgi:hypothetical protein
MQQMPPELTNWNPIAANAVQARFGNFKDWSICGGISLDILAGVTTRTHGDIDIGVFRSQVETCLKEIGESSVYLCDPPGAFTKWDGKSVPAHVNDIWITSIDGSFWELQVLVYSDDAEEVYFKRDDAISWTKESHSWNVRGYSILNPAITMLYKSNKSPIPAKDAQDISLIIKLLNTPGSLNA